MTNYYIEKDNNIVLFDTDRHKLENTLAFMPELNGLEILETQRPIAMSKDLNAYVFADTQEYQAQELEHLKEEKLLQVNAAKEQAFKEGIIFKDAHFDCDDRAQDRTGNRLLLLQAMPVETLEWLDYNYQAIELTAGEFQQLCASIFERIQFIEFKTGQLLDAIAACENVQELEAIEINFTESEDTNE